MTEQSLEESTIVSLLEKIGNFFSSGTDLTETIDSILKATLEVIPYRSATLFLLEESTTTLRAVASRPYGHNIHKVKSFQVGEGAIGWVAKNLMPLILPDTSQDHRFKKISAGYEKRSLLVVPLHTTRHLVGALSLGRDINHPFSNLESALAQVLAHQTAISIENAKFYRTQAQQLAEIAEQKKQIENKSKEIEEISKRKSAFLANTSHELRTPLNSILGFSELMIYPELAGKLSDEKKESMLKNIHAAGQHLLSLVNSVLDLSKIEAGKMALSKEQFLLSSAIDEVKDVLMGLVKGQGLSLEEDVFPVDLAVFADKSKFKQIIYNLLSNAIKFTPKEGRVWIHARAENDELTLEVGDTGLGIAAENLEKIFEEFYRVEQVEREHYEGTGLGLPLVKKLVSLHQGHIKVDSFVDRGSLFTITMPLGLSESKYATPEFHIIEENETQKTHLKLASINNKYLALIVDDNQPHRELSKHILEGNGFVVNEASNGEEAWRQLKAENYDIVLTDLKMPILDGLSLIARIKSTPQTANTPVVVISADAMKGGPEKAFEAGCDGYITKPVEGRRLIAQIKSFLLATPRGNEKKVSESEVNLAGKSKQKQSSN